MNYFLRALVTTLVVAGFIIVPGSAASAADEEIIESFTVYGAGWGHGRGMGQYGAYGYASLEGWSSAQILDHYYGGTEAGTVPADSAIDPDRLRVDLSSRIGDPTLVQLGDGQIEVTDSDGRTIGSVTGAVRVVADRGDWTVEAADSCSGPWRSLAVSSADRVMLAANSTAADHSGLLEVCGAVRTWYDGEIWVTIGNGEQRTINLVSVEQYLRGVVPNEMPASWPAPALEAQSVAARSYVMAGDPRRGTFSDTCDTIYCQVYDGRYTTRSGWRRSTHPNSDAAIAATAGLVRLRDGGTTVARTEFSSSTGGYTVGWDFPAVEDRGDSISANPNHRWQAEVDADRLVARYRRGGLIGLEVIDRDGNGPFGGRVETIVMRFEEGEVTVSGDRFRYEAGLKSDLFSLTGDDDSVSRPEPESEPEPEAESDPEPEDVAPDHSDLVELLYQRYLGRSPNPAELEAGRELVDDDDIEVLTSALSNHSEFAGLMVDELYRSALGREPEAFGRRHWIDRLTSGMALEAAGSRFFGSPEYFDRAGGTNSAFVESLYQEVLGRRSDAFGHTHWTAQLDRGASTSSVAGSFYRSLESRRARAARLVQTILDRPPTPDERDTLAQRLVTETDLEVAAEIGRWDLVTSASSG